MPRLTVLMRLAWILAAACSLACLGLGTWLLRQTPEGKAEECLLRIHPLKQSLGDLPPGADVPLRFRVTNLSNRPIRLLGAEGHCFPWWRRYGVDFPDDTETSIPVLSFPADDLTGSVAWVQVEGMPVRVDPGACQEICLSLRVCKVSRSVAILGEVVLYSDAPGCERRSLPIDGRVVTISTR